MSEDRSSHEPSERSWLERLAQAFAPEPDSREDLLEMLEIARENKVIDRDAAHIIEGAVQVADMQVRDIMVPRPQMEVIRAASSLRESLPRIIDAAHSRYPVVGESADEVLGILLAKDLLPLILSNGIDSSDVPSLMRPAFFVPESKRLNVLLREFREKRQHMAIVLDEYGSLAGLVTIEDILEQIVGEIEDEYDEDSDNVIKKVADNDYIVKALTSIEDFNDYFGCELSDEDFDTIGGLVTKAFGHLPRRGETTAIGEFNFKVLNADKRRLHLLRLSRREPAAAGEGTG